MRIYNFKELNSTNEYLKINHHLYKEFAIISAETQTNGKARRGNVWFSNVGMALFTFYIKKNSTLTYDKQLKLPLLAGLAVHDGLKSIINLDYKLKWTNDIYLNDKKLSGILVEEFENKIFIGIGINVNNNVPEEVKNIATSLNNETKKTFEISTIILKIVETFKKIYNSFIFENSWQEILLKINKINYLYDKEISLNIRGEAINGIAKNINSNGELEIKIGDKINSFSEGEVMKERIVKQIEATEYSTQEFIKLKKLGFDPIAVFFITNYTNQNDINFINNFTFKNKLKLETLFVNENSLSNETVLNYLKLITKKYKAKNIF